MNRTLNLAMAQINWLVGDIEGNTDTMLRIMSQHTADIIIFSELSLCGYPAEDLLYRDDFYLRCQQQLARIQQASLTQAVIVGHPHREAGHLYNSLSFFYQGQRLARYDKQQLPNYGIFDEKRYFAAGKTPCVVDFKGYQLGLLICEDLWSDDAIDACVTANAEVIISINASPYQCHKRSVRQELLTRHSQRTRLPIIYLNQVGGQDELVFDGQSMVVDQHGQITHQLSPFSEQIEQVQFNDLTIVPMVQPAVPLAPVAEIYQALVLAVRDYVEKSHFPGVVLGLSGGIDSALTLAIAVDALGHERVHAVMMPFHYTAQISIDDAQAQANALGVAFDTISIAPIYEAFMAQLDPFIADKPRDTTEENLQARCRGVLLMALSNKLGRLVLTTGNKSEMAVGYSTLYGDMAGGFDVLKDVPKTLVFQLARYRNTLGEVIPQRVIDRPPSAELSPDQKDEDSLPPYPVLDAILARYIENDSSVEALVTEGFDEAMVRKVIRLVDINEYKRRQAPIGPKITERNFGKERRYPLVSGFGKKNW